MSDKTLLTKFAAIIISNNKVLLEAVDEKIIASEKRVKEEITRELSKKIKEYQKDTIEVLSEMTHTGYKMHEKRIKRIETKLGIPTAKPQ